MDPNEDQDARQKSEIDGFDVDWTFTGIELHLGEILNLFGVTNFVCSNPTPMTTFDVKNLEGTWF